MNIYIPGPRTILRDAISYGVEVASPALTALGEHVGDADNIAHSAYNAGGKPIATAFSDLRRRRGSRPAALVCTAVERVASKAFYHKYRLLGTAKKAVNTAIAVLETVEAVCAHQLLKTDEAPPAESLTSAAILGTRPAANGKVTLPPHTVSLVVDTFNWLSATFGGDFHVRLANFLSRVSPRGFLYLRTALEDLYEWVIEMTKQHIRFGRERFPILPRTTYYLLTVSIAVLVFLLAVISAFPEDGVVRRHALGGQEAYYASGHYGRLEDEASLDTIIEVAEDSYDEGHETLLEDEGSIGGEDTSFQDGNSDESVTMQNLSVDLGQDETENDNEGENQKTIYNTGIVPEEINVVLMTTMDLETRTESKKDVNDVKDENRAVELATTVYGFGGFEVDDSLVCNFEQTGGHGIANAAPPTPTLPLQIRAEQELSGVSIMAQAAPSTPTSNPTVAHQHKRKEFTVKRSRKTFRFPRTAPKIPLVAPKKTKVARKSSASRRVSTPTSSSTLSTSRTPSRTPSTPPPSSVSIRSRQRTRPRSFQDFMKNW